MSPVIACCGVVLCRTLFLGNYDVNVLAVALETLGLVSNRTLH
jgi:hypothetical protein